MFFTHILSVCFIPTGQDIFAIFLCMENMLLSNNGLACMHKELPKHYIIYVLLG